MVAHDRQRAETRGRRAERWAAWYLRLHGWRILATRARIAGGEVDIVARRARTIAFVEVKWRERAADLDLAIDAQRLRRVAVAAERLAPRYAANGEDVRIDALLLAPGRWPRHLVNIWHN
jgi:putative endonuclease